VSACAVIRTFPERFLRGFVQAWRDVEYGPKRTVPSIALQRILVVISVIIVLTTRIPPFATICIAAKQHIRPEVRFAVSPLHPNWQGPARARQVGVGPASQRCWQCCTDEHLSLAA
jgi:hypothetical protein